LASSTSRVQLLQELDSTLRKVGAQSVLISDLVATRVGLNSTDLECLDLLYLAGVTTAGKLAKHTGLTTGAITAVIDRLERAGFARRRRDTADRRCVLVEVVPSSAARVQPLYEPLVARVLELNKDYDDEQLATVVDYLSRALAVGAEHVTWLQTQPVQARRGAGRRQPRPAPRAKRGVSRGTPPAVKPSSR
jgi:DNA-binding MarR family transcriptional regulator